MEALAPARSDQREGRRRGRPEGNREGGPEGNREGGPEGNREGGPEAQRKPDTAPLVAEGSSKISAASTAAANFGG
jgi:hypothetical protein